MPVFDISFLNPKNASSGGSTYNTLVDQLSIKEAELAGDGVLSPGDYDLLANLARKVYTSPGLTANQRSNVLVKIADYNKGKSTTSLKDNQDLTRINGGHVDDLTKNVMLFGNDPKTLLQTNADATKSKLQELASAIDQIQTAGGDASQHINEYSKTLNDFQDLLHAQQDVNNYKGEGQPDSPYVAFMTTNPQGEITDVKVGRVGANSGYVETNGIYGGLQIYGKINSKENGKNVFNLGNTKFSAADLLLPDASNPGAMKANRLIAEDQQSRGGQGFDTASANTFKPIDPTTVRVQGAIPTGAWAKGSGGTLYQRLDNGQYKKYVNVDQNTLGVPDNLVMRVPKFMEQSINANVGSTFDGAGQTIVPQGFMGPLGPKESYSPVGSSPATTPAPDTVPAPAAPGGTPRTPQPQTRAPETAQPLAQRFMQGIKNFLGT